MPTLDLTTEKPVSGTSADATQIASGFTEIQTVVNGLDSANFASGKIFDLTKLTQGGAATGALLYWNGSDWAAAANVKLDHANNRITFGSGADVNLYRSAADTLKTDDVLVSDLAIHGRGVGTTGEAFRIGNDMSLWEIDASNTMQFRGVQDATAAILQFGSGGDTNLYRGAANSLRTDDEFVAIGGLRVGAAANVLTKAVFEGTGTFNPGLMTNGTTAYLSITVTGAAVGDVCSNPGFSVALPNAQTGDGWRVGIRVTAADTALLQVSNLTGSSQTPTSCTASVLVWDRT